MVLDANARRLDQTEVRVFQRQWVWHLSTDSLAPVAGSVVFAIKIILSRSLGFSKGQIKYYLNIYTFDLSLNL